MHKIPVAIIDDQEDFRNALKADIADYCPELQVIGEADGLVSAAKLLKKIDPKIIFLDIDLGDGTGFDLIDIINEKKYKIIFTTSSDSYAIRAFRYSAIDYLLKPVDPDQLVDAVEKCKNLSSDERQLDILKEGLELPKDSSLTRLALASQDKIQIVEVQNVVRCESQGNYTDFHFNDGSKIMISKTLKEYDDILRQNAFIRVHQSHLVNTKYIKEFVKVDGGYILLKDDTAIPVSTRRRTFVIDYLTNLA
ncbi:MAG: LytTR family DNA-binding domain-containing protein [Flavobacteriales bacterium]|nr:LytTR family DNA-binding domain-containing protein [Flavobacteriales bacterium]